MSDLSSCRHRQNISTVFKIVKITKRWNEGIKNLTEVRAFIMRLFWDNTYGLWPYFCSNWVWTIRVRVNLNVSITKHWFKSWDRRENVKIKRDSNKPGCFHSLALQWHRGLPYDLSIETSGLTGKHFKDFGLIFWNSVIIFSKNKTVSCTLFTQSFHNVAELNYKGLVFYPNAGRL